MYVMMQNGTPYSNIGKGDFMELHDGDTLYFSENGHVYSGKAMNVTEKTFQLDCYGGCEGFYTISRYELGRNYFLRREDVIFRP